MARAAARRATWWWLVVAAVVLLPLLAAALLARLADLGVVRERAVRLVKSQTGYDLAIDGPVRFVWLPRPAVSMDDLRLSDPRAGRLVAEAERIRVAVRVRPLLRARLEPAGVAVRGAWVRLGPGRAARNLRLDLDAAARATPAAFALAFEIAPHGAIVAPPDRTTVRPAGLEVSLDGRIGVDSGGGTVEISDLRGRVGGSRLAGVLSARDLRGAPVLEGSLQVDRIDTDEVLALAPLPASPAATAGGRAPTIRLALAAGRVIAPGVALEDFSGRLTGRSGRVALDGLKAVLAGGRVTATAVIEPGGSGIAWRLAATLAGARLRSLLDSAGATARADGSTSATVRIQGVAGGSGDVLRTLAGTAAVSIRDGWIEGIDLLETLRAARVPSARRADPRAIEPGGRRTPFTRLSASARIQGGVARSDDVRVESDEVRAGGACVLDLPAATIDCLLRATSPLVPDTVVPVTVRGPLSAPRYGVAVGRLLRDEAEEELRRRLRRGIGRWLRPPGS